MELGITPIISSGMVFQVRNIHPKATNSTKKRF